MVKILNLINLKSSIMYLKCIQSEGVWKLSEPTVYVQIAKNVETESVEICK